MTIELSEDDLRVIRMALEAYLEEFGHQEGDLIHRIKEVIAKLPKA